jgi:amphiphysin
MQSNRGYTALFQSGVNFADHFAKLFEPIQGEYDLLGKYPEATQTSRNISSYQNVLEELRQTIVPELELIESRIVNPVRELQTVLKTIRKMITKRDHKVAIAFSSSYTLFLKS